MSEPFVEPHIDNEGDILPGETVVVESKEELLMGNPVHIEETEEKVTQKTTSIDLEKEILVIVSPVDEDIVQILASEKPGPVAQIAP